MMKQITQKELIDLIKEKQENAKNMFYETRDSEKDFGEAPLKKTRCLAEMDTYQDLICYLDSVEIVPERNDELDALQYAMKGLTYMPKEQIVTTIPKAKQEELNKVWEKKTLIMPYSEPKIEPLRDDRFREFEFQDIGTTTYDAMKISYISKDHKGISIDGHLLYSGYGYDYDELIVWWKYWKQI